DHSVDPASSRAGPGPEERGTSLATSLLYLARPDLIHDWRPIMPRVPRALAFAGALLLMVVSKGNFCTVAHASENCPASVLTYWTRFHGGDSYIPAATFDTTIVNIDGDMARVSFDHATAHVALNAVGGVWAGVRVLERFDVSGVPVGTLVHATLTLSLEGEVFNAG